MRKIFITIIMLFLIPTWVFALEHNSKYVYFYNLNREDEIYEVKSHERIAIASMTKIMTAYVALNNINDLDAKVKLTSKDFKGLREANASTAGFREGEVVTYRDLLYGLLLPSGADAALALSNNIAGSEQAFVNLMNEQVKEMGLKDTHFVNTTGLDVKGHYSSAYDVYLILRNALENEQFKEIFTTKKYTTSNSRLTFRSTLYSASIKYDLDTNFILGSKSGYTYAAGLCLASISEHDGEIYILVTAGANYKDKKPYHITDSVAIYRYFFDNYEYKKLLNKGDIIVSLKDEYDNERVYYAKEDVAEYVEKNSEINKTYNSKNELTKDLEVGDLLGVYEIYADNKLVYYQNIYLDQEINNYSLELIIFFGSILIIFIIVKLIKSKRKGKR